MSDTTTSAAPYTKPLPEMAPEARPFWDAAKEHRLRLQPGGRDPSRVRQGCRHGEGRQRDHDQADAERHEPERAADHEQHRQEQERERQIKQRRRQAPGEQLAAELELTEACQLRRQRRAFGQRQR